MVNSVTERSGRSHTIVTRRRVAEPAEFGVGVRWCACDYVSVCAVVRWCAWISWVVRFCGLPFRAWLLGAHVPLRS